MEVKVKIKPEIWIITHFPAAPTLPVSLLHTINPLAPEFFFFLISEHPVYKM